jgi:hypothetical protein
MPCNPILDDVRQAQRRGLVAVRAADGFPLSPCHPARARALDVDARELRDVKIINLHDFMSIENTY